ncbi:HNH endonuclease [Solwaraspora sp. WMMA2080]|uniref:HNH endonuclease n=1 Tax=unclassified Solwaraspora TaxID=2627926 RepID=UPI00248B9C95|nr:MULTISPECIES: HNH endonuclease [unclassified Solwaraspora]WBB94894.1 HNH endonuclease [Solwaraspora sp. WMMA2059]WBC21222.1 HNH endonuclease [Solwaraspora sp. WMMA2080]
MKAFVGVTDGEWRSFLAARPQINEVNFWRPGGGSFKVLTPGEPFFFKSRYPHNRIVGGGFFSGFAKLRLSEAWGLFGEANGAGSLADMARDIGKYRRDPIGPGEDPVIGCIFIRDTVFFPEGRQPEPPPEFSPNLTQGKTYDLSSGTHFDYFEQLTKLLLGGEVRVDPEGAWHRPGPVFGDPRLRPQRLGQQSFKAVVLDTYSRRCAITDSKLRPALQAAHIRPVAAGGEHRIDNGMLLRADVHILFDQGYLGVDPKYRLLVSRRLRDDFGNGEQFYARAGTEIAVPEQKARRPDHDLLEWHTDTVFQH